LTKELSETEFKITFGTKMTGVTETAEPVVDIWDYVEELVNQNIVDKHVLENKLVDKVYRNDTSTFDQVLLPTDNKNVFIVLVVDIENETFFGHFKLDLNKKYGLTE
jgi:hypothetical protein